MRVGFEAWGLNFQVNRPLINWEKIELCHVCHCFFIAAFSITIVVCFFVFKGASNDDSIFICIKQHCCCKCTVSVETKNAFKVENIEEDILDLIPSPSPSVKIQIMGGKVYLR